MVGNNESWHILFRSTCSSTRGSFFDLPSVSVFGMSQFLFQAPAGYLYDYTESKVLWLSLAAVATTLLTVFTAAFAAPEGANMGLM